MAQSCSLMQFLVLALAAWLSRQQEAFIEYLKAENRMLKGRLGYRRMIFTDAERRLLARYAKAVGRKKLYELDPIVSPDTLLRWHRQLIELKWTFQRKGPGRPRVIGTIQALVVRMASENPRWGYTRIQGALSNLGHKFARGTIANILKREGLEPAPTRGKRTPWAVFLKAHWRSLVAADFLSVKRFVRSIKEECLDRMIFFGEGSLRRAVGEFMAHYHAERNNQGVGNRLIRVEPPSIAAHRPIERRIRLGGMLSFYQYGAA